MADVENIEIRLFSDNDLCDFTDMFCTYFRNDFMIEISDNQVKELCSEIAEKSISGIIMLDILLHDEKMIGFVCYQIDSSYSDWCEREGWGLIREIYVKQTKRGRGFGLRLVTHAEKILYSKGVEHIYLTSDEAGSFWSSCGYNKTGKVSYINHDPIYEK